MTARRLERDRLPGATRASRRPGWIAGAWRATAVAIALTAVAAVPTARAQHTADDTLLIVGQSARVEAGRRVRAAVVVGGDLEVAGQVDSGAVAIGGDLRVLPGARIEGSAVSVGGALQIDPAASVQGARAQVEAGNFSQVFGQLSELGGNASAPPVWAWRVMRLFQVLALLVLAVPLVLLWPRQVRVVRRTLVEQRGKAAALGLVLMIGTLPVCVVLALSLVGLPLIPVVLLALLAAMVMGLTAIGVSIGARLPLIHDPENQLGAAALGLGLVALAVLLPVLGGLLLWLGAFHGAGAVLLSRFGTRSLPGSPPAQSRPADVLEEGHPAHST